MCPKCGAAAEVLPGSGQVGDEVTSFYRCEDCAHTWAEDATILWQIPEGPRERPDDQ